MNRDQHQREDLRIALRMDWASTDLPLFNPIGLSRIILWVENPKIITPYTPQTHKNKADKALAVVENLVEARSKGVTAVFPRMRYSAKPGNPSKSSIRQIKLYSVAVALFLLVNAISSGKFHLV